MRCWPRRCPASGIYSGYELCENEAIPGKEEYLNSEKYEIKVRDWNGTPGNIVPIIARINQIRRNSPALQTYNEVLFLGSNNESVIAYAKMNADRSDIVVCVVNLDPFHTQAATIQIPLGTFGIHYGEQYEAHDLLSDERYRWGGPTAYVEPESRWQDGAHHQDPARAVAQPTTEHFRGNSGPSRRVSITAWQRSARPPLRFRQRLRSTARKGENRNTALQRTQST